MALFDFLRDNWPLMIGPLLGLVAIYSLLPGPKRRPVLLGVAVGLAALLVGGFVVARVGAVTGIEMTIEVFLFYVFAAAAILGGAMLITQHNPARAALSFVMVILATCGLFLLQAGPFLTVATIIVYAGAIIVTFLFVIMLAQQEGLSSADARSREPFLSSMTGFLLLVALLYILKITYKPDLDRWVAKSRDKLELIQTLRQTPGEPTPAEKQALVQDLRQFSIAYGRWLRNDWLSEDRRDTTRAPKKGPPGGKDLRDVILNVESALPAEGSNNTLNLARLEEVLARLYVVGKATRNDPLLGSLWPNTTGTNHMSELSGPRSSHDSKDLRRDAEGRPYLPAENTVYLGRSLFTDYLLPVELAGTLLLVATVGAIAISSRKLEKKKPSAPVQGPAPRRTV